MDPVTKIKTVIIDQDEEFLFLMKEHLAFFPEIELKGMASKKRLVKKLLINEKPDLVFMDPEAVEVVDELRVEGFDDFHIVFCAADESFLIEALHESALDFFLKPVKPNDLKDAINRYKDRVNRLQSLPAHVVPDPVTFDVISLPTLTGLQFLNTRDIVLFQCIREMKCDKPSWQALLTGFNRVRLRKSTTAKEIAEHMGQSGFAQINQSVIVNLVYMEQIEYKTRICKLISPYDKIRLTVSRTHLSELRNRFDLL